MKGEAWLFTGTAVFFGATTLVYGWLAREPAGIAALCVSFIMASLVAAYLWRCLLYTRSWRPPAGGPSSPPAATFPSWRPRAVR